MKGHWLRLIGFLLAVLACVVYLGKVVGACQTVCVNAEGTTITIAGLYVEPRNTLDALSLGSSTSRAMVFPKTIWDDQGVALYSLATPHQDARLGYYLLRDALRLQKPSILLINPSFLFDTAENEQSSEYVQMILAAMRPSPVKLGMQLDYARRLDVSLPELLLPLFHFHGRVEELMLSDFSLRAYVRAHPFRGTSVYLKRYAGELPGTYLQQARQPVAYDSDGLYYTEKILDLCRQNKIQPLFVSPPKIGWTRQHHDLAAAFCARHGADYLDYNETDRLAAIGFDTADYVDAGRHANLQGQIKLSVDLGEYLREHYDLADHRGDARYCAWDALTLPDAAE